MSSDGTAKPGAATTNPLKIDKELQKIWNPITAGNFPQQQAKRAGAAFLDKYKDYFAFQQEAQVPPITVDKLREGILASPDNATGLDSVSAADLRLLSPLALQGLATMYQAIEGGDAWPKQTAVARTAWLDKTEGPIPSLEPLEYRGLAILSKIYRLYFAIRLGDLGPWIKGWEEPELFAGTTAATGAEDAWYLTALELELAKLCGQTITGGRAVICKCFDQI